MNASRFSVTPDDDPNELLTAEDRAWISDVYADDVLDPGRVTPAQLAAMNARDRERYRMQRTRYLRMVPLLETSVVRDVMGKLRLIANSAIRSDLHQQDIPILNGEPGVGKTMMLKTHAAEEMMRLALHRSIELEDGTARALTTFRPVIYAHLKSTMTRYDVIRLLCDELGWPSDRNPQRAFERAVARCGVQLVIIDEIQHVNFDGKTGRHVHNIIRWMSNFGLRVVLGGTDADGVLSGVGAPAVEVAARNSRGRWIRVDVPKMEIGGRRELTAWVDLIFSFESRLRLTQAPLEEGWLADNFAEYMWARTQGYLNSLVLLINLAAATAIETGAETIDRKILDSVELEDEVERQRPQRMAKFEADNPAPRRAEGDDDGPDLQDRQAS
ncbi:ATP-binding protein [uncultured Plantibacter sp.]|uniref:ATP-binding protein n=1 Tax=uncultured Plantibacter sp. TaxID=293337 RepID=UPI0028D6B948|nr:ATP-binding protein [uncultured Plantibacter sp.]